MRIGFVTQWFPPEPGTVVASAIADGLAAAGHQVDVLTGFPNYPSGTLAAGYRIRPYLREMRSERVTVHRAALYPSHDRSAIRRMANYLSFAVSAAVVAARRLPVPDVWLVYSSPATAALPALTTQRRRRIPLVTIVQDLWPDSVTESGMLATPAVRRVVDRLLGRYCDAVYARSAAVAVISPGMATVLHARGVPSTKVRLCYNWIDDAHLAPHLPASDELRAELGLPRGRLFMYAGNLGAHQNLMPVIEAFARCPDAHLALVGDGVERETIAAFVRDRALNNVMLIPSQPTDAIGRYIAASDVQVVSLADTPLLRATMPSKVQVATAAGRAVLAHAAGDVAQLIRDTDAGVAAHPGDVPDIAAAIEHLMHLSADDLRAMGERARGVFESEFDASHGVSRIVGLLQDAHAAAGLRSAPMDARRTA